MTDPFAEARDRETNDELDAAAKLYASSGFENLIEAGFEPNRTYRVGVATLIRAIGCSVRAGNGCQSDGLRRLTKGAIEHVLETDPGIDDCLLGLYHEWLGDVDLLTGSAHAETHYLTAADHYERVPEGEQLSWGMEEEFDYVYWAVEAYLAAKGFEEMERLPELEFERRVRTKLELLDSDSLLDVSG